MIKIIPVIVFSLFSSTAFSFECRETNNSYEASKHWSLASDVILATVLDGQVTDEESGAQSYTIKIKAILKGSETSEKIKISNESSFVYPGLAIGSSYLFFFYGSRAIDFCSLIVDLGGYAFDMESLKHLSERKDIEFSSEIKYILERSKEQP